MTPARWLTDRLRGKWHGEFGSAPCPAHEDRHPSLTLRDGHDDVLLKCHAACAPRAVIDALKGQCLWPIPAEIGDRAADRRNMGACDHGKTALDIWKRRTQPIDGTAAELYLRNRHVTIPLPPSLRYSSALKHKETGLFLPAMVAAIQTPDRSVIAIQRTFIKASGQGKAPVTNAKMTLGGMARGAVRLAAAAETLGIAEGIETGLSAMQLFEVPVWCSLGSERLGKLELPPEVRHVVLFADNGDAGRKAAMRAVETYTGQRRKVTLRFPPAEFRDFNDVLAAERRAEA